MCAPIHCDTLKTSEDSENAKSPVLTATVFLVTIFMIKCLWIVTIITVTTINNHLRSALMGWNCCPHLKVVLLCLVHKRKVLESSRDFAWAWQSPQLHQSQKQRNYFPHSLLYCLFIVDGRHLFTLQQQRFFGYIEVHGHSFWTLHFEFTKQIYGSKKTKAR